MDSPTFLSYLNFDNRFTAMLPGDTESRNFTRQVSKACFSRVRPKRASQPYLVAFSREMCDALGIKIEDAMRPAFVDVFSGNRMLTGMDPFAMCYGGHQFGNWAGQLGDGRAINLGEVVSACGQRWMLQLKGAGPTPYSRSADGLAVMRSSIREFLCSEAMHHLGVPTTRALSVVGTGDLVERDMFYDGNPKMEPGAIVCRVAPSFTRFGNFQILAARNDIENLQKLVEHTLRIDFPHLSFSQLDDSILNAWFVEVRDRTIEMVVHWMRVGFVHGVMNTDNMSILGLTIDYGPYGWLEDYDPLWTPNTTDAYGRRYRFEMQPNVAHWNLWQFANALIPLLEQTDGVQAALDAFPDLYQRRWNDMVAQKLGLSEYCAQTDASLFEQLFELLRAIEGDMTIFFRRLSQLKKTAAAESTQRWETLLQECTYSESGWSEDVRQRSAEWFKNYLRRLQTEVASDDDRRARMDAVNPKYVLRNYLAQQAIDRAESGDFSEVLSLLDLLRRPYDEQPDHARFDARRPQWARHRPGCSMLSCSS